MNGKSWSALFLLLSLLLAGPAGTWAAPAGAQGTFPDPAVEPGRAGLDPEPGVAAIPAAMDSPDWRATVERDIARSEYRITWQELEAGTMVAALLSTAGAGEAAPWGGPFVPGGAYQAPNRAHNLRTYFAPGGILVVPRLCGGGACLDPAWHWGLRLAGWGREDALQSAPEARLYPGSDQISYGRPGLNEQYFNDEGGLQQVWTIEAPSQGSSPSPLVLELAFSGNLVPQLAAEGTAVVWATSMGGAILRYEQVTALDAAGRELAPRFSLSPGRLSIVLDDVAARYPLTLRFGITQLSTSPDWDAVGGQADANFGWSVSTAGDVNGDGISDVLVGAPYYDGGLADEGAAFVFLGSLGGLEPAYDWHAEGDQANAHFGASVGLAGDVDGDGYGDVIIGAADYDVISGTDTLVDAGKSFVYHGSAGGLSLTPDWTAVVNQAEAYFGTSVGLAGDVNGDGSSDVIVGARSFDNGELDEGAAFVYLGSAGGLTSVPGWTAEGGQVGADFGISVGTAGDVNGDGYADVIVGADLYNNGQTDEGMAFVFHGSSSGLDTTAAWVGEGNQSFCSFAVTVSTAGDLNGDGYSDIIVGAPYRDQWEPNEGQVFVWYGSASGLNAAFDWRGESNGTDVFFGASVSTAGDVNGDGYADIIIGAPGLSTLASDGGGLFAWFGSADGLGPIGVPGNVDWLVEGDQAGARLGEAVANAGDVNGDGLSDVIAGAPYYEDVDNNEGAVFIYQGLHPSASAAFNVELSETANAFASSVSTAGDVDGDGYADVIIGAPNFDGGAGEVGQVLVYMGSSSGLGAAATWTADGDQAGGKFGISVGRAGDVNGDGYADVIVGAEEYDHGELNEGRAYLYQGSAAGLEATPAWTAESDQAGARFGASVGTAGDVNGDGYADVIVGAPLYDNVQDAEGRTMVYYGSSAGLSASPRWTAEIDQAGARFGTSVGTAGDVDGDGFSDVIVGAHFYDNGQNDEGAAFVYCGSETGLSGSPDWSGESNQPVAYFGWSVGTAGDVNGDGFADVIVGAYFYDNGEGEEGTAFVYHGSAGGLSGSVSWMAESDLEGGWFGWSVATAGDVNGDGFADVVIGTPGYNDGNNVDAGRAYLYQGSSAGLGTQPSWIDDRNSHYLNFGYSVATAGDTNGDGFADLLIGAPGNNNRKAYIYYGGGGGGPSLTPRQLRLNGTAPIAPLGVTPSAFQVQLTGRIPVGRDKVRLQWQVAPLGTPFTATGVLSGSSPGWTDVLTQGVVITDSIAGLAQGTGYHWRARLLYHPGNRLGQPAGRWIHIPWNGWNELDLSTLEPVLGVTAINDGPTSLGLVTALTATANGGSGLAFRWDYGDGDTGEGPLVTHVYPTLGVFMAVVTASNELGFVTDTTVVAIIEAIGGVIATSDSPTLLGQVTTLTATALGGTDISYAWDFGDGQSGSGAVLTHLYPAAGVYEALVTASNSVSLVTATTTVVVEEGIAGLAAVNDGPTVLGNPTALTATIATGGSPLFTWSFGNGQTGSGAVVTYTYPLPGVYEAVVTASNSVSLVTATTTVYVDSIIAGLAAANDSPTTLGDATHFTATVSVGSNALYDWAFGDGQHGAGAMAAHTYLLPGVYEALVTASNSVGLVTTTTTVYVVEEIIGLDAVNDSPTALGSSTAFTASIIAGSDVAYEWAFGDGGESLGAVVTHTYAAAGVYEALVTASNSVCLVTATTTVVVDEAIAGLAAVNDGPTALGSATAFTASIVAGSNVTYEWAFGDGGGGSGAVVTHTYSSVGVYEAVVTASNSVSLVTATTTVYVDSIIAGLAAVNDGPTLLGEPTTLTATVAGGSNVTYEWVFADGGGSFGAVVTHTYAAAGVYEALVTARNYVSLVTATTTVVVDEAIAGLAAVNDGPTMLGSPTTLTATVAGGSNVLYEWDLGDGQGVSGAVVSHTYPAEGVYVAVVTASNVVSLMTATTTVYVSADCDPVSAVVFSWAPLAPHMGEEITFNGAAQGTPPIAFVWDFGDGITGTGALASHTYDAHGVYMVTLVATNACGEASALRPVRVVQWQIYMPLVLKRYGS